MKQILITLITATLALTVVAADNNTSSGTQLTAPPSGMSPLDHPFEVGAIFGEPTGVSVKYWLSDTTAIDGGLGWLFDDDTDLHLHGDFLWHNFELFSVSKGQLPLYFGVGARGELRDNKDDRFGIRFPVGLSYLFENVPLSLFVEVAPVLDIAPSTRGDLTAGIGIRFRF